MKVCIAEKPSVAREIANILGANTKRDGFYEGNGYAVTYTFGHLCTLLEPKDYKPHWKSWDLNNLPMLPERFDTKVTGDAGIKKQFSIVKSLFEKADVIINCGDAGTEGELIQRWVINQCGYKGEVQRLWISSLTEEAIKGKPTDEQESILDKSMNVWNTLKEMGPKVIKEAIKDPKKHISQIQEQLGNIGE